MGLHGSGAPAKASERVEQGILEGALVAVNAGRDGWIGGCAVVHAFENRSRESWINDLCATPVLRQNNGLRVPVGSQKVLGNQEVDVRHDCAKQCKESRCRFP